MGIKQITIFVSNKSGRLSEVTKILEQHNIDILALSIADTIDYGILRLIVADPVSAEAALKESGLTFKVTEVLGIVVDHKPGGLSKALCALTDIGMSVEYLYAFVGTSKEDAMVILKVSDIEKAIDHLNDNGVRILTQKDVENM